MEMFTPVKAIKRQCKELKQRDRAFNDLSLRTKSIWHLGQGWLRAIKRVQVKKAHE